MKRSALAILVGLAGCGNDGVVAVDAASSPDVALDVDASPAPGRPWGVIDGLCVGEVGKPRVLVYTRENQWRHESNFAARLAIYNMCQSRGFNVLTTNDPLAINAARLSEIDVIVFSITSGSDMDVLGQADLQAWIAAGGGLVGLHSASATESTWPFYVNDIGAEFLGHVPGMQEATMRVQPATHPITDGIAASYVWTEEWYFFKTRPEEIPGAQMLIALDESTLPADYPAQYKVGFHPIAWARENAGGRMFYTALGHNPAAFADPYILELVGRSIEWAAHQR